MSYIIKTSHDYKYYVQKEYFKTTSPELIRYLISNYKISSLTLLCISNRCYMSNKVEHSGMKTHVDVCKIRYFIIIINIKDLHYGGHTLSIIKSRKYSSSSFSFSVLNLLIIFFFSTLPVEVTY